jgi:integrase/recombinase XerD
MDANNLGHRVERYLELRHCLGFQTRSAGRLLRGFARFVHERNHTGPLTAQIAVDWACSTAGRCGPAGQSHRLGLARQFMTYLRASVPETEIPGIGIIAGWRRPNPYIYSHDNIRALMAAARALPPRGSLRPHTFSTLIGLMASCGLRGSEAIHLDVEDVLLDVVPARAQVRNTKFHKSRWIPLHVTTEEALRAYTLERNRLGYDGFCQAFFVSENRSRLTYSTVARTFVALARQLGIRGPVGERGASLHGLRHTFAVERMLRWYGEGEDVQARLPELSVYLGHVSPENTYWYLTATPELLSAAADRFEVYAQTEDAL